jgi:hypothetical protein
MHDMLLLYSGRVFCNFSLTPCSRHEWNFAKLITLVCRRRTLRTPILSSINRIKCN